jgi:DNA-binding HxlR family transcriptional regulator
MNGKRSYGDGCAAAHALDLIGERWALLIVRELLLGPKRFTDLRGGLAGISANVLSQRLTDLESAGVVTRGRLPPPASAAVYELTPWGRELEPVLLLLVRWGVRSPAFQRGSPLNPDALVLSFRTLFDPARARGRDTRITLNLDGQPFTGAVRDGCLDIRRQSPTDEPAEAVLDTDPTTLLHMAYGHVPLDAMLAQERAACRGDRQAIERFLGCFSVPPVDAGAA